MDFSLFSQYIDLWNLVDGQKKLHKKWIFTVQLVCRSLEFGGWSEKVASKNGFFTVQLVCRSLEFGGWSEKVDQKMDFLLFSQYVDLWNLVDCQKKSDQNMDFFRCDLIKRHPLGAFINQISVDISIIKVFTLCSLFINL